MITAGIDAGSRAIKIVLFDIQRQTVFATAVCDQGTNQKVRARRLYDNLLRENGLGHKAIRTLVATGYGRHMLDFCDTTVTEISCHAAGVLHHVSDATTVIDIGGQDSKLIRVGADGKVRDFVMNDRCAAGTGRFLEVVSQRLNIPLDALGPAAERSEHPAKISSMCVVFAETEIIGLLAGGQSCENIIAGVQRSIAQRTVAMGGKDIAPPVVFTGGVALISGMKEALERLLELPVNICPAPQFTGALGASILAAKYET
ncbi:MAG: acyl-CoA dehydratase activase [Verrucomicrobia bacterium]|nr:acyl-CoA dehydratase activase [Verrucomicrobiota bacterium]